ncbi:Conserved_hypothetical protein [Hexamita inflata]|uniref:Uncharacterized protein n=1 Tax=Hexamita inflata TaxID=28002 RepID=A0AA86UMV5_9EUKA|nr:Conserved hypothetical protein [Hexamita inflata]CAI9971210.1 Conserved hypothetical protein [Hexamita inflata]CAI9975973.1 Conserved hypothetical protein [Hexamita inflata]
MSQPPKFDLPLPDSGQLFIEPIKEEVQFCQPKLLPIVSNQVLLMESKMKK